MKDLRVGEVAVKAGVHVPTIHYYERRGLLPRPPRTAANYRLFPADAVQRVRFIKRAQDLGFTLHEIKELIALRDGSGRPRGEVRTFAEAKMRDIDQKLARLQSIRGTLNGLVESCACGRRPTCPILEALNDPDDEPPVTPRPSHGKQ